MNETIKTILNRRSIRSYKTEQIKDSELHKILEAGKFAPSAMNEQSWHFTVVQNADLLTKINEACRAMLIKSGNPMFAERAKSESFSVFYNAPTYIIVSGSEKAIAANIDCALALENMFLAGESMGIGSCWIHAVNQLFASEENNALMAELQIPEGFKVFCSGAFGYVAGRFPEAADRKENTVTILK